MGIKHIHKMTKNRFKVASNVDKNRMICDKIRLVKEVISH